MYGIIAKIKAVSGQRDALADILIEGSRGMPGCLSYVVARDPADADALWVTEVWDSPESHRASLSAPSVRQAIERGRDLIAGFEQRFETEPVAGHGLAPSAQAAASPVSGMHVRFSELPAVDQDRAVRFYTENLGLRVAEDRPYQEGWRWILLEIPGAQTMLRLSPKAAGSPSDVPALVLTVDDVYARYREMKVKGVVFTQEPTPAFWNPQEVFAVLRDSEDNLVMLGSETSPPLKKP